MSDFFSVLKEKMSKLKTVNIAFALGIIGIVLIGFSSVFDSEDDKNTGNDSPQPTNKFTIDEYSGYEIAKEAELKELLESMDGVGKAKVMVNVECSQEYVYAIFESRSENHDGESSGYEYSYDYFVSEEDGDTSPLMTKVLCPKISSCVVACQGADDAVVCEAVYMAVSAALDIPYSDIYVGKLS